MSENDIDTILAEYEGLVEKLNETKKQLMVQIQEKFSTTVVQFLNAQTKVNAIVWRQYTPYWNDGEACYFGRHGTFVVHSLSEEQMTDRDYDVYEFPEYYGSFYESDKKQFSEAGFTEKEVEQLEKLLRTLNDIPDDFYEFAFGDHVEVTITKDGVQVEEYSHD